MPCKPLPLRFKAQYGEKVYSPHHFKGKEANLQLQIRHKSRHQKEPSYLEVKRDETGPLTAMEYKIGATKALLQRLCTWGACHNSATKHPLSFCIRICFKVWKHSMYAKNLDPCLKDCFRVITVTYIRPHFLPQGYPPLLKKLSATEPHSH